MATLAPSRSAAAAHSRPRPAPTPVTITVLPSSSIRPAPPERSRTGSTLERDRHVAPCSEEMAVEFRQPFPRDGLDGRQPTGPLTSVIVAVCERLELSVHPIVSLSPGWCCCMIELRSVGDVTPLPASDVITSPALIPARAAVDPEMVPATSAPDVPLVGGLICTPRKALGPMCTVEELWPDVICRAMVTARLIGMANPPAF